MSEHVDFQEIWINLLKQQWGGNIADVTQNWTLVLAFSRKSYTASLFTNDAFEDSTLEGMIKREKMDPYCSQKETEAT